MFTFMCFFKHLEFFNITHCKKKIVKKIISKKKLLFFTNFAKNIILKEFWLTLGDSDIIHELCK